MAELITSDQNKCMRCGECIEICPMGIIGRSRQGYPVPISDAYKLCINCGYCVDVCDFEALKHRVRKRNTMTTAAKRRLQKKREMNKLLGKK